MIGWKSKDGWWFVYAEGPSFSCPIGSAEALSASMERACEEAGIDPGWLWRKLRHHAERRRDESGRLTDRCVACGHKMERVGFLVQVERPMREDEERMGDRIVMRLGGDPTRIVKSSYCATKREARQWAYDEFDLHRSVMAEKA